VYVLKQKRRDLLRRVTVSILGQGNAGVSRSSWIALSKGLKNYLVGWHVVTAREEEEVLFKKKKKQTTFANLWNFYRFPRQPNVELVREYFGEEMAFFFHWYLLLASKN